MNASRMLVVLAALVPSLAGAVGCGVGVPAVGFGSYDVFAAAALQSTTTLTVTCAKGPGDPSSVSVSFSVALSTGSSASYAQRRLTSGANTLNYNLYTNSARTLIWGDGTGGSQLVSGNLGLTNGNPQRSREFTVFGQMPARQNAAVGSYADSLLVTVNY